MTTLLFDLEAIDGSSSEFDSIKISVPEPRASSTVPGIIMPREVIISDGPGEKRVDVEPGLIEVKLATRNRSFIVRGNIPDVEEYPLSALLTQDKVLPPTVADELWTAFRALRGEDFAEMSEESARRSEASALRSEAAAYAAKTSETNTKTSETNVKASETNTKESETKAKTSEKNAKTSETKAASFAASADESKQAAAGHAESARTDAQRVENIATSTRWIGDQVEVNGKLSPHLTGTALEEEPLANPVNISALVAENRAGLVASHPYTDPSDAQVNNVLAAVRMLMQGKSAAAPSGMEIIEGYASDAKRNVRVLRSVPGNGLYWGMWVFPINFRISGIVEAPHPVFDSGSDDIAAEVWKRAPNGTVLAVAGSHRTNPDGTDPRDAAHNTKSMWHRITTQIAQAGYPEFQIHGFSDASMPGVGAVVSSGSSPLSAGVVRTEAFIAASGITTARQWDGSATQLIGMNNIQGDEAAQRGNPFLHIELSKTVRDNPQKFIDAAVSAGFLAGENGALLSNEVPKPVGSVNSRGSSSTAARADHTHRLVQNDPVDGEIVVRQSGGWRSVPVSTVFTMPQGVDSAVTNVESATENNVPGTIVKRSASGSISIGAPGEASHATTKAYVDQIAASKADLVGGLVPTSQLPAVALTKPHVVSSRTAMLALTAQEGDIAVITTGADKGTYMLGSGAASTFASWVKLANPDEAVTSVNGQVGVVNLSATDVGAAASTHSHAPEDTAGLRPVMDAVGGATYSNTANTLMKRTSTGAVSVSTPTASVHAANKAYVDSAVAGLIVEGNVDATDGKLHIVYEG